MIFTSLETFLIACGPAIASVLGCITAAGTILVKFGALIKEIKNNTDNQELRDELKKSIAESEELKKQQKTLIEQLTRVKYEDIK